MHSIGNQGIIEKNMETTLVYGDGIVTLYLLQLSRE